VALTIQNTMSDLDEARSEEPYVEGLRLLLRQPEFAQKDKMLMLMDLMDENRRRIGHKLSSETEEGVQVQIGEECKMKPSRI